MLIRGATGGGGGQEIPLSFKRNTNLVISLFDWPITKIIYQKEEKKTPQFIPIKRRKKQPMLQKETSIL